MDIFLDATENGSKMSDLFEQLRQAITSGRLAAGDRLPPTRALADELGVSRTTITTVYGRLAAEGYVEGRTSAGTFVTSTMAAAGADHRLSPDRTSSPAALRSRRAVPNEIATWSAAGPAETAIHHDLRTGRPDPDLFPTSEWRRAINSAVRAEPSGYGDPGGLPALRRSLAQWVGRSRGVETTAEEIVVTAGAQQAVDLVARVLLVPGDTVAVEDPGYPPVRALLSALGLEVVPVPVDDEGIVVSEIPPRARLIHVTPSHQSPTGVVMSLTRRRQLLSFADAHGLAVIEDDYDSEFRHVDRPLEPLHRLDSNGRVLYVGTFSKTLTPSLRLGFVAAPPSLSRDLLALRTAVDWQPPQLTQHALHRLIVDGDFERHLRRTRREYSRRHAVVVEWLAAAQERGLVARAHHHAAGLHTTAELPPTVEEAAVRSIARRRGVALSSHGFCRVSATGPETLMVGFGGVSSQALPEALRSLDESLLAALGNFAD